MKIAILSKNKPHPAQHADIDYFAYNDTLQNINFNEYSNYDYIIILNILCFIKKDQLIQFLIQKHPAYASIPNYWGLGSSDILILHKSIFMNLEQNRTITELNSIDENTICTIFSNIIKCKTLESLLSLNTIARYARYKRYNIVNIKNIIYSTSYNIGSAVYHNGIFINHTNDPEYFASWSKEYASGQKIIFINNKTLRTIIGINFFIIKGKHIALLGENEYYFWSHKKQQWLQIKNKKYINYIQYYILKKVPNSYKILKLKD